MDAKKPQMGAITIEALVRVLATALDSASDAFSRMDDSEVEAFSDGARWAVKTAVALAGELGGDQE